MEHPLVTAPGLALERPTTHGFFAKLKGWLPEGHALPEPAWAARHKFILFFLFAHAVGLAIFGLVQGWHPAYALGEGALLAAVAGVASLPRLSRSFRSGSAAFGAAMSSAVFTQFWGGYIEGHFHYFVIVALIALYQDWVPFLLAIAFVAFDHGLIGTLAPTWVYNHPAAIANPWPWALAHAVLVLAEAFVLIVLWKANERDRARTDLVLSSTGDGILGLDVDQRVTFANPAAAALLGQSLPKMLGQPIHAVLTAGAGLAAPSAVALRRESNRGQFAVRRQKIDVPVEWAMHPVREHTNVVGSVLTLVDASERVHAEQERTKRVQQLSELERLQELDKFKTLFINTAAHELHTPLTPLRLHIYALKEGHRGELSADQLSAVDVLDRNVERLTHLVDDVLNAARLQASRMSLERTEHDLATLVHEAVDSFQESARHAGISLEADLQPGLHVSIDARRLTQVVFNLLDNAIKFTPKGGRIQVRVSREGGGALIRVTDNGVGIPADQIGKLFQPFSQAHSPMERTRAGSGLGLYISRGIVELHGGRIECSSEGMGKGTTLSVFLPI